MPKNPGDSRSKKEKPLSTEMTDFFNLHLGKIRKLLNVDKLNMEDTYWNLEKLIHEENLKNKTSSRKFSKDSLRKFIRDNAELEQALEKNTEYKNKKFKGRKQAVRDLLKKLPGVSSLEVKKHLEEKGYGPISRNHAGMLLIEIRKEKEAKRK